MASPPPPPPPSLPPDGRKRDGPLPKLEDLPPFEEAAQEAYRKAKEAGAGKYPPGSIKDSQRHLDQVARSQQQQQPQQQSTSTSSSSSAAVPSGEGALSDQKGTAMPPVVRSALTFAAQSMLITSRALGRATPGAAGGLLYQGKSFSFACGFRDGSRGFDNDDKGNHMRLRDPIGLHRLTIPVTGILAWKLHKENKFDLMRPITEYLPELPREFDSVSSRDVLGHRVGLSDAAIFKSAGATIPAWIDPKRYEKFSAQVWRPVGETFKAPTASQSRAALMTHLVKNHKTLPRTRRLVNLRGQMSHTAVALLAHAIERATNDSYENLIEMNVFKPIETPSAGFGPPHVIKRSHIFYQPGGVPAGHYRSLTALPVETEVNAAPPVFNASLNMFANAEDFAKLAVIFFEGGVNATKEFPAPNGPAGYHELGLWYEPGPKTFWVSQDVMGSEAATPFAGAANYDLEKDVGAFALTNCGSRRARALTNLASSMTTRLFKKQVIDTGINVFEDDAQATPPPDLRVQAAPRGKYVEHAAKSDMNEMDELADHKRYRRYTGGNDKHTRL